MLNFRFVELPPSPAAQPDGEQLAYRVTVLAVDTDSSVAFGGLAMLSKGYYRVTTAPRTS